jgi:Peptidase propeptide and YPEB domain
MDEENETEQFPPARVEHGMGKITRLVGCIAFMTLVTGSGSALVAASQSELMKEARVSKSQAEETALGKVRHGVIKSEELEREHGKLVWSFDIATSGTKNITEVQVDAMTGKIVSVLVETPKDQAKEAAADKVEKK